MQKADINRILLAHGGGGRLTEQLIRRNILPKFENSILSQLGDSSKLTLNSKSLYFTTDSYVVKPLFFNGGDIGKLAVCGTVNDLAVAGAKPVALSLSLLIEEGFEFEKLERILDSISIAAKESNVEVVTGDTKTVEAGGIDEIFINTSGVGEPLDGVDLGLHKVKAGDKVIINGTIGDHGLAVMSQREGLEFQTELESDCAGLGGLICELLEKENGVKFMRDPTRGGLAATLNEIAKGSNFNIEINENDIPVKTIAQAAADMLGFDVLTIANEGKFVAVVEPDSADKFLQSCKAHPLGKEAAVIGEVTENAAQPRVELNTKIGGKRIVQMPYGRELPRIC